MSDEQIKAVQELIACLKKYQARYHAAAHARKDFERSKQALKRWEEVKP